MKIDSATQRRVRSFTNIDLSLDGWEQYEAEKRGGFSGTTVSSPCSLVIPIWTLSLGTL